MDCDSPSCAGTPGSAQIGSPSYGGTGSLQGGCPSYDGAYMRKARAPDETKHASNTVEMGSAGRMQGHESAAENMHIYDSTRGEGAHMGLP